MSKPVQIFSTGNFPLTQWYSCHCVLLYGVHYYTNFPSVSFRLNHPIHQVHSRILYRTGSQNTDVFFPTTSGIILRGGYSSFSYINLKWIEPPPPPLPLYHTLSHKTLKISQFSEYYPLQSDMLYMLVTTPTPNPPPCQNQLSNIWFY